MHGVFIILFLSIISTIVNIILLITDAYIGMLPFAITIVVGATLWLGTPCSVAVAFGMFLVLGIIFIGAWNLLKGKRFFPLITSGIYFLDIICMLMLFPEYFTLNIITSFLTASLCLIGALVAGKSKNTGKKNNEALKYTEKLK